MGGMVADCSGRYTEDMVSELRAWIADVERRPVTRRNRLGVWLAILTCPCHAGWLIVLTGGSAFGAVLADWGPWLYGAFGLAFLGSLAVAFGRDRSTCVQCRD
jgi:hypothetical protein